MNTEDQNLQNEFNNYVGEVEAFLVAPKRSAYFVLRDAEKVLALRVPLSSRQISATPQQVETLRALAEVAMDGTEMVGKPDVSFAGWLTVLEAAIAQGQGGAPNSAHSGNTDFGVSQVKEAARSFEARIAIRRSQFR